MYHLSLFSARNMQVTKGRKSSPISCQIREKFELLWCPVCAISLFCIFAAIRRHAKRRKNEKTLCEKKREKTKKTPCEKTKRQNNAMRKEETRNAKRRNFSAKRQKTLCEKTPFGTLILSSFRVASFPLFAWRYFVLSSFRDEKTLCEKTK